MHFPTSHRFVHIALTNLLIIRTVVTNIVATGAARLAQTAEIVPHRCSKDHHRCVHGGRVRFELAVEIQSEQGDAEADELGEMEIEKG